MSINPGSGSMGEPMREQIEQMREPVREQIEHVRELGLTLYPSFVYCSSTRKKIDALVVKCLL